MSHIKGFVKRELTLCIAFAAAAASCFAVPPDKAYFGYLDFRTLALLYALMVVVIVVSSSAPAYSRSMMVAGVPAGA